MRCLYCDGKLPLYRKIAHGQFCSATHRKAYWQEQERLAVERLSQTHTSLTASRLSQEDAPIPVGRPRAGYWQGFGEGVPLGGYRVESPKPQPHPAPPMLVADPLAYDLERQPEKPEGNVPEHTAGSQVGLMGQIGLAGKIGFIGPEAGLSKEEWAKKAARQDCGDGTTSHLRGEAFPYEKRVSVLAERPRLNLSLGKLEVGDSSREAVACAVPPSAPPVSEFAAALAGAGRKISPQISKRKQRRGALMSLAMPAAARGVNQSVLVSSGPLASRALQKPELGAGPRSAIADWRPPQLGGRIPLAVGALTAPFVPAAQRVEPFTVKLSAPGAAIGPLLAKSVNWVAALAVAPRVLPGEPYTAKIGTAAGLALCSPALGSPALGSGEARALNTAVREPVRLHTASTQLPLRLAMGGCSRYPIAPRAVGIRRIETRPVRFLARPLPPEFAHSGLLAPQIGGLVALHCMLKPTLVPPAAPISSKVGTIPQPLRTEPIHPSLRLEPLDAKPAADLLQPDYGDAAAGAVKDDEAPAPANASAAMGGVANAHKAHLWNRAAGFWKLAPRDLKLLAFAIPLLLALAFHRELPKVRVSAPSAPSTVDLSQNVKAVVNTRWSTVRQAVVDRAAVALDEDFRSGLDDWASRSDATAEWSFDAAGFVKPGPLALYRPSMMLTDYQVQFLGMIDKKALSWVVRAQDFDNYYVLKLEVLKPGPRTTVGLTRYAVIDGKAVDRVDTVVPLEAQPDTLYRVRMELDGDTFSLTIQGQMVDSWDEPRLPKGGVGFFTGRGEESSIRWVALTHQYDMLGRLCAYLAPYETQIANGGW